ncbi:calcium/sodium antiporter [Aliifodinibius salipaludis]|uniref:calcium/sodium antiporter n=1 Tax=Fodinibius salipaludis TaxID=2032627 RepID=UPI001C3F0CE9|nr:calcium/sodium antiporter [Aliifodinibius salipaludis]
MVATILFFIAGLLLLIGGAELLVRGASKLAARLGMSSLVIGLTVVAFGTSAPELAISMQSGFAGESDLLLGNVIGSNIFNVLLILGLSAIITPLVVSKKLIKLDVPFMIVVSIVLYLFALSGSINRIEGIILFVTLLIYLGYLVYDSQQNNPEEQEQLPEDNSRQAGDHWLWHLFFVVAGLGLLVLGARWLVDSAVTFAEYLGLSSLIIGLTIVAAGTSLPEVATSIMASIKGERDMAVGNIVGSNLFNMMCIVGLTATVLPEDISVADGVLAFDLPVMIAVSIACLPIFFTGNVIARWEGVLFLIYYLVFTTYLILTASQHNLLPLFNAAMIWFILPITVITIIIISVREFKHRTYRDGEFK